MTQELRETMLSLLSDKECLEHGSYTNDVINIRIPVNNSIELCAANVRPVNHPQEFRGISENDQAATLDLDQFSYNNIQFQSISSKAINDTVYYGGGFYW